MYLILIGWDDILPKSKLLIKLIILGSIVFLVLLSLENANTAKPTLESYPNAVYENPKNNGLQDVITSFGLIIVALLLVVLAKSLFDYIRIRNQSLLISY